MMRFTRNDLKPLFTVGKSWLRIIDIFYIFSCNKITTSVCLLVFPLKSPDRRISIYRLRNIQYGIVLPFCVTGGYLSLYHTKLEAIDEAVFVDSRWDHVLYILLMDNL